MEHQKRLLSILTEKLKQKTGLDGSSFQQCTRISVQMREKGIHISPHTIARLFGDVLPQRKFYLNTLNLIARFLDYAGWDAFVKTEQAPSAITYTTAKGEPNPDHVFLSSFRYALIKGDVRLQKRLLDKAARQGIFTDFNTRFLCAIEMGRYARTHKDDQGFFRLMAEHPFGRDVFYRTFVDEDDADGYFSHNLKTYFLPTARIPSDILFAETFLHSRDIYTNVIAGRENISDMVNIPFKELLNELHACHFISRQAESRLLIASSQKVIENILDEVLMLEDQFSTWDFTWVLGRCLRALHYRKASAFAFEHPDIKAACSRTMETMPASITTVPQLLVQLHAWIGSKYQSDAGSMLRPASGMEDSIYQKMIIEHLTLASIPAYVDRPLLRQTVDMARMFGQLWAVPLAEHLLQSSKRA